MPSLNWLGRDAVVGQHYDVPYHFLDRRYGSGDNMIVHGDNLLALKSLMPRFERRIKLIFVDPDDSEDIDHWLCMIYPRLRLMQKLLADDGSIWIASSDRLQNYLRDVCNEIFGAHNFVANVLWECEPSKHEFVLVFAKDKNRWRPNLLPRTAVMDARYKNPDNDPRGPWKSTDFTAKRVTPSDIYPITTPSGRVVYPPEGRSWVSSEKKFLELVADGRISFGPSDDGVPRKKTFLSEVRQGSVSKTLWLRAEVGDNQEAKRELKTLFGGESVFDTPKPVRLLDKILRLSTDKNSIVLDAFGGSGTTAHAVINLNRTDGGDRKFILIESQPYAETIIAERIRRVDPTVEFSFYELGERLLLEDGRLNPAVDLERLREYVYFSETRQPLPTVDRKYLLGIHNGVAYYFLFERDRQLMLTADFVFSTLDDGAVERVIFAPATNCGDRFLGKYRAEFRRIPSGILLF